MSDLPYICIFSAFYPPHLGGVEIYTRSIALKLVEMGYRVCIVTSQLGTEPDVETNGELTIVRIPTWHLMEDRFPLIKPSIITWRLIRYLLGMDIGWIVVNTRYYPLSHLGLRIAKRKGIQAILLDHSSGPIDSSKSFLGWSMRAYERVATRSVIKSEAACFGVSSKSNTWLKSLGLNACGVIPNAINAEAFISSASQRSFRDELALAKDAFLVVFAGRLLADKGVCELCSAVDAASKNRPGMHLAIAGSGPLEAKLSSLQNTHIHMLGRLTQSDLASLLSESDVMCLPSRYPEGLPTILLEAAAADNALVVTDNGGTDEVVPTSDHGIVLERCSVEDIQTALEQLYDDQEATSRLAFCARKHVEANLNWERTAQALVEACKMTNPHIQHHTNPVEQNKILKDNESTPYGQ